MVWPPALSWSNHRSQPYLACDFQQPRHLSLMTLWLDYSEHSPSSSGIGMHPQTSQPTGVRRLHTELQRIRKIMERIVTWEIGDYSIFSSGPLRQIAYQFLEHCSIVHYNWLNYSRLSSSYVSWSITCPKLSRHHGSSQITPPASPNV